MYFPSPWITLLSFVYIFFTGVFSVVLSRKLVEIYLYKFKSKLFKIFEPVVGSVGFVVSFGLSLYLLYLFIIRVS